MLMNTLVYYCIDTFCHVKFAEVFNEFFLEKSIVLI